MSKQKVVLAFSGGLDTSFCVPYLADKGYEVHTLFVDAGGVDAEEKQYIAERAMELGAAEHHVADIADEIWAEIVCPALAAGEFYQYQYPLLCSDRYLIVRKSLQLCDELGTNVFAHGCTGMGNDQVRFDLTVQSLGDYQIIAPIREIQRESGNVREYEMNYLKERGFGVRAKTAQYTINENLLGMTISGSEVDEWKNPGPDTWVMAKHRSEWPEKPLQIDVTFQHGVPVAINGEQKQGAEILQILNEQLGAYGVGRGYYTGDTTIGLKGRIVFIAPALTGLMIAHRALEEAVASKQQNGFKPQVAKKWVELVYQGFFYDPLKFDLEAFLHSSQLTVNGTVTLETEGGIVHPAVVDSPHILRSRDATYAQTATWGAAEAEGFITLFGQSSRLWSTVNREYIEQLK